MADQTTYRQLSLSVKYNSVLFPFDILLFLRSLEKNGFVLEEQIAAIPFGARVEANGIVARKANASIRIDADKQVLAVHCPNAKDAADELASIETLLKKEFGLDSPKFAHFYELLVTVVVKSKKDPIASLNTQVAGVSMTQKFSNLLGRDVGLFGLRLGPKGIVPNHTNWFDIQIEPFVVSPVDNYIMRIVYRNSSREDVFGFAQKLDSFLREVAAIVENDTTN